MAISNMARFAVVNWQKIRDSDWHSGVILIFNFDQTINGIQICDFDSH